MIIPQIRRYLKKLNSHAVKRIVVRTAKRTLRTSHHLWFALLVKSSPLLATKYIYRKRTGKKLNLANPQDLNEKIQWLKLYWQHPLVVQCADKYEVRSYVRDCGCEELLNEQYGVYDHPTQINWEALPQQFVIKCTHGCRYNIICGNKDLLDIPESLKKLNRWIRSDYSLQLAEIHYSKIRPRIIIEKYLDTDAGFLPIDYQLYCFHGEPQLIQVVFKQNGVVKLARMDSNWRKSDTDDPTHKFYYQGELPTKPTSFDDMMTYARILSKPFPFVRVDFFEYHSKPILSELTFTPGAGAITSRTPQGLLDIGRLLHLPPRYKNLTTSLDKSHTTQL